MEAAMMPHGWKRVKVADICRLQNGNGFRPHQWAECGYPIIRIQNLNGSNKFNYFNGQPDDRWLVYPGQMLFAWAGTKGASFGPTIWKGDVGVLNQHIFKVHAKPGVDNGWLYLALSYVTKRIEAGAHGFKATLVHVKKSEIDGQEIGLPPLAEQRRIADMISTWDRGIETLEGLIRNSSLALRVLKHQVLFGKRRLRGFNQPRSATTIGAVCEQVTERAAGRADLPVLSCSKHDGFVESLSYFKKKVFSDDLSNYKVVRRGMIAFPTNHVEEGSIALQDVCDVGLVSPIYCVFQPGRATDANFLIKLLKTDTYAQLFAASTNASVDRRGSLRWKEFSKIKLSLPTLEEQRAIAEVIEIAERELAALEGQRDHLRQEKAALLQQLFSGKRRIAASAEAA